MTLFADITPSSLYQEDPAPAAGTGLESMAPSGTELGHIWDDLIKLRELPAGWNSYHAKEISDLAIRRALAILTESRWSGPRPSVTPTPPGGIQLEWGNDEAGVEVEINAAGAITVLVTEPEHNWEAAVTGPGDPLLQEALLWAYKLA